VADAAVHHGGSGTALSAVAVGVPQLLLPDGSDRFLTAEAVRERGVGLSATVDDIDSELLGRLLTDSRLASAATEVAAEVAAMPAPGAVASQMASLLG